MYKRFIAIGTIVAAVLLPHGRAVASGQMDIRAASQSVHFRIVIPEVNPLRLGGNVAVLGADEMKALAAASGDSATRMVVEDALGRHHVRHVGQSGDQVRLTLATP